MAHLGYYFLAAGISLAASFLRYYFIPTSYYFFAMYIYQLLIVFCVGGGTLIVDVSAGQLF
jgi:hypothetical protein